MDYKPRIVYGEGMDLTVQFEFPPDGDPFGESVEASNVVTTAADGGLQNNQQFVAKAFKPKFIFVTSAIQAEFHTFALAWGLLKRTFLYYPHSDVDTGVITCTLVNDKIDYGRPLPDGMGGFLYEFTIGLRAVIS